MSSKIQNIRNRLHDGGFDDPRVLGLVLLAVIGLSVVWNGIGIVQRNYELQQRVDILGEQNKILELENQNKVLQNEYFKTPEYAELRARRINGKAAPGERVYIIEDETALAALKTPEQAPQAEQDSVSEKPSYQQNFESWVDFFFGS